MNQYLMYLLIGVGILLVCLVIPGLKVIAEAVVKIMLDFTTELLKHKSTFFIWLVKTLSQDHRQILDHAFKSRDTLDPTQRIRRKQEGYED